MVNLNLGLRDNKVLGKMIPHLHFFLLLRLMLSPKLLKDMTKITFVIVGVDLDPES